MSSRLISLVILLSLCAGTLWSQQPGLSRALDLERRGDYRAAVDAYRQVLRTSPADISALLGLERSLLPLNRTGEIIPAVQNALAAAPRNTAVYGIALRAWAAA